MRVRHLATGATLALLCSVLIGGTTSCQVRSPVHSRHVARTDRALGPGRERRCSAARPARRRCLVRAVDRATFVPDHAYTLWFVVINNPGGLRGITMQRPGHPAQPGHCLPDDLRSRPHRRKQAAAARSQDRSRSARSTGWLPDAALSAPRTAEVQLVLNDHGPVLKGYLPGMIQTYRAGCTDASLPGIFPPSAKADGTPGPNACQLYQAAVFAGS